MSILSLAEVAVARDAAPPGMKTRATKRAVAQPPPPAPGAPAPAAQPSPPERVAAPEQTTAETLTSAIPTETLAVYTGIVGIFVASGDPGVVNGYLPFRWSAFGSFVLVTVLGVWMAYLGKRQQKKGRKSGFPALEAVTAALAAAVWGLVMPGSPLIVELSGEVRTITITTITLAGSAMVTALSSLLTKGVQKPR
jgi:hypothetical protein